MTKQYICVNDPFSFCRDTEKWQKAQEEDGTHLIMEKKCEKDPNDCEHLIPPSYTVDPNKLAPSGIRHTLVRKEEKPEAKAIKKPKEETAQQRMI